MTNETPPRRLRSSSSLFGETFTTLMLCAAILAQLFLLAGSSLPERLTQAWENRQLSPLQRGARIGFGDRFGEYIDFLRATIPEDGAVLLPPEEIDDTLSHVGLMQFFLFPRPVFNCPKSQAVETCLASLRGGESYLLAVGAFPERVVVAQDWILLSHDARRGVYAPSH